MVECKTRLFALLLVGFLINSTCGWAEANASTQIEPAGANVAKNAEDAKLPFKIGSSASRAIQKVTGVTMLTQFVVGQVAGMVIHRKLGGKVKVKFRTWSLTDCLAGKIKSVDIRIKQCSYKGTKIGDVQVASATPIWVRYFKKAGNNAGLRTPILLSLTGKVTQEDVAKALKTEKVASSLRGLKLDLPGLGEQQLEVLNPVVSMSEDKVKINGTLVTARASEDTGVPLTISGKLSLKGDDRIVLENMVVDSAEILEPQKFAAFIEQLLNPLVNLQRFDRRNLAVRLNTLQLEDGFVQARGKVLVAPRQAPPATPELAVK